MIFIKFLKFGLGLKRYQNKGNLIDYYVYISKNLLIPHVNQRDCSIDVFINFKNNFILIKPCNYITMTKYDLYNIHNAPNGCTHISFPSYGTKTWGACRIISVH